MPIDPNIILQAGRFEKPDFNRSLTTALGVIGARDDQAIRQQQLAIGQRQIAAADASQAAAQAKQARMGTIGGMLAAGDLEGGQREALGGGDVEFAKQIDGMKDDRRQRAIENIKGSSGLFGALLQVPAVMRKKAALGMADQFGIYGIKPEKLAEIDYSDQGLALLGNQALTRVEQLGQSNEDRTFNAGRIDAATAKANADRNYKLDVAKFGETKAQNNRDNAYKAAGLQLEREKAGVGVKLTEGQAKDGFNAKRLAGAGAIIDGFENTPGFAPGGTGVGAFFGGDESQRYEAAKGEWVDSLIRLTTGAAATEDEIESAKTTYFPGIRDGDKAVTQKAQMRTRVMQDAITRAGPGAAGMAPPSGATAPRLPAGGGVMKPGAVAGGKITTGQDGIRVWMPS